MPQILKIFISSPGDTREERLQTGLIIQKLASDYSRFFTLVPYDWQYEPMLASGTFQDSIEPPSAHDIVILILWSRLGTPLPDKYHGLDGRHPVTGTEWEFEDALKTAKERGAPDILAFRSRRPALFDPQDAAAVADAHAQVEALDRFWRRYFVDRGIIKAGSSEYGSLDEFAAKLEEQLRKLIEQRLHERPDLPQAIWPGDPFRGLEAYEFEHARIFFGRDGAVAKAALQLAGRALSGTPFLLISGPSGSGKSSLVRAALVPRLMMPQQISGAAFLRRAIFRPSDRSDDVLQGIVDLLAKRGDDEAIGLPELLAPGQNAASLVEHLRAAPDTPGFVFAGALGRVTEAQRKLGRILGFEDAKLILVIDQLEELFTLPSVTPQARQLFLRFLAGPPSLAAFGSSPRSAPTFGLARRRSLNY